MRLTDREFNAMNNAARRFLQRTVEYPNFRRMGLKHETGCDMLEIGCGSGYGAALLAGLRPKSYVGVDLMPEQIALAQKRLPDYDFMVRDAADLSCFPDGSKDVIVIFGVLHHIPGWERVVGECHRVLREGGRLYVEEPYGGFVAQFDRLFHWDHHALGLFTLRDLERTLQETGFSIVRRLRAFGFGVYTARKGNGA